MTAETNITAQSSKDNLPDDTDTLKDMVLTLLGQIDDLNGQLHYLKRQLFGKKSEKLDPKQRLMFENLYDEIKAKIEKKKKPKVKKAGQKSNHKGRKKLPEDLPREIIEIEPDKDEMVCPECNNQKQCIGSEETEKLEYVPASFKVKKYSLFKRIYGFQSVVAMLQGCDIGPIQAI